MFAEHVMVLQTYPIFSKKCFIRLLLLVVNRFVQMKQNLLQECVYWRYSLIIST